MTGIGRKSGKMRLAAYTLILSFAFATSAQAAAISTEAGTKTGQFLKFEPGSRYAAMGGTYAAYGTDVFSLWGQPAALGTAPSAWQVGFQHAEIFQGVTQEYIGVAGGINDRSRIGVVVNTVGISDLLRATENGAGQLTGTGGTFGARDLSVGVNYGWRMNEEITLGAAGKYVGSRIDNVSAAGFAADFGAQMRLRNIEDLTLGASVTNVGTGLKFLRTRDQFPTAFRLGAAYRFRSLRLLLAADAVKALDRDIDGGVGAEWQPIDALKLRVGYRAAGRDLGEGLTAGIGFNLAGLDIDYAYVPYGVLGDAHRISAGYSFGGGSEHVEREATPTPEEAPSVAAPRVRVLKRP